MKLGNFVNIIGSILKVNPWGGHFRFISNDMQKNIECNLLIF
jgi:hypothetical protein